MSIIGCFIRFLLRWNGEWYRIIAQSEIAGGVFVSCKITVLLENIAPEGLEAEHGLSLFVETPETTFIFDCGQTGMAWRNAERLGVRLSSAQFVVISHSHYDHAKGFPSLLGYMKPEVLYTGPGFWQEKYTYDKTSGQYLYKGGGFNASDLANWGIGHRVCEGILAVDSTARLMTGFERRSPFEKIPQKFRRGEMKEPDPFDDEVCLLLKEGYGLVLVVGCSHRGILNIVFAVQEQTGLPVRRIIGGIHLDGASRERIERTLQELNRLGIRELDLCHCSGNVVPRTISTGSVIELA